MRLERKLYTRGNSFETTIPKPIMFSLDLEKKHKVIFIYDNEHKRWYLDFEPLTSNSAAEKKEDKHGSKK